MESSNHQSSSSAGSTLAHSSPMSDTDAHISTLLTSVSSALAERAEKHVFAIGGKVDGSTSSDQDADVSVVVRWDSGELGQGWNVRLPVGDDAVSKRAFAQLLADCEPAAFEVGSEGVLNETYRRASALDASKFSTDFHPYENGILDTIIQGLAHGAHPSDRHNRGIRAELHKLNVSHPLSRNDSFWLSLIRWIDLFRTVRKVGVPYQHTTFHRGNGLTRGLSSPRTPR